MFGQKFFPYSTLQELNLDWILTKVKNILRFVPDDGAVGQILRRTRDGAEWSNEQGGGGAVDSVNGQTGTVVLTASDVGALPDSYTAPVTSVNTKTGAVVLDKTDIGLGNVANVAQYSASNPPPYPVTSVNTKTGAVVLDKTDIGLGNVANVAQYSASNPPPYPVTSVNGMTGDVVVQGGGSALDAYPVGSIYMSVNNTSPATLFGGGTWVQLKDRFLLGAGDTYTAGDTGGEAVHTLTVDEIPAHSHKWPSKYSTNVGAYIWYTPWTNNAGTIDAQVRAHTEDTGGGQAHNNMPPYLVVYMWQRTA